MTREAGSKDPLHGITLEMMVNRLVEHYGWEDLGRLIRINPFIHEPTVTSALRFLRRNEWARKQVEELYRCVPPKNKGL